MKPILKCLSHVFLWGLFAGGSLAMAKSLAVATVKTDFGHAEHTSALGLQKIGPSPKTFDVVLLIDNSGSMGEYQTLIHNTASQLVRLFLAEQVSFHLAALTTDYAENGAFRAVGITQRFLTDQTVGVESLAPNLVAVGTSGNSLERPLQHLVRAIQRTVAGDINENFVRPHASRIVIVISDEDDGSSLPVRDYAMGLRQSLNPLSVVLVTRDHANCINNRAPAARLLDLANYLPLTTLSICGDFSTEIERLMETEIRRSVQPKPGNNK